MRTFLGLLAFRYLFKHHHRPAARHRSVGERDYPAVWQ